MGKFYRDIKSDLGNLPEPYDNSTPGLIKTIYTTRLKEFLNRIIFNISYVGVIPGSPPTPEALVTTVQLVTDSVEINWTNDNNAFSTMKASLNTSLASVLIGSNVVIPSGTSIAFPSININYTQPDLANSADIWSLFEELIIEQINLTYQKSYPAGILGAGTASVTSININNE